MRRWVRTQHVAMPYAQRTLDSVGKQRSRKGTGKAYRIVMRSELSERYAAAFEGMEMETKTGQTVLMGQVMDQTQLHGILDRIGGLGLELVSVQSAPATSREDAESYPWVTGQAD
jgi:hypothetical protein